MDEISILRREMERLKQERDEWERKSKRNGLAAALITESIAERLGSQPNLSNILLGITALKTERDEATCLFKDVCRDVDRMKTEDPHKRIEELEQALAESESFDAPAELVKARCDAAESGEDK